MIDYTKITKKKSLLDSYGPLPPALTANLREWFTVELTYTSNALEGNTLTRLETATVVEKHITIGGKTLREHLEAHNHAIALTWLEKQQERDVSSITEDDILMLHGILLKNINDDNAGRYRSVGVRISGSRVVMPNHLKVSSLMTEFISWLQTPSDLHPVELAAQAHYKLITIHPFIDGNGRTARLLMNMILMMCDYPPAIIDVEDRNTYINTLEKAQLGGSLDDFLQLIATAVEKSLDIYLEAIEDSE